MTYSITNKWEFAEQLIDEAYHTVAHQQHMTVEQKVCAVAAIIGIARMCADDPYTRTHHCKHVFEHATYRIQCLFAPYMDKDIAPKEEEDGE